MQYKGVRDGSMGRILNAHAPRVVPRQGRTVYGSVLIGRKAQYTWQRYGGLLRSPALSKLIVSEAHLRLSDVCLREVILENDRLRECSGQHLKWLITLSFDSES